MHGTAKFDLTFELAEEGELRGWIEYSTDLFSGETVARMAGHFTTLLAEAVADPDRRISSLRMLTAGEERLLLGRAEPDFEYEVEHGPSKCVQELFEEQAAANPEATALEFGGERLTYRELNARANRLARHLVRRGVGPESACRHQRGAFGRDGRCPARRAEGRRGRTVPLDPNYPHARLASMLEDAAVGLLLTTRQLAERLPELKAEVVGLDDPNAFAAESAENPARRAAPANAAYVIYTSGSTGRPKGVIVSHAALRHLVAWHTEAASLVPRDPDDDAGLDRVRRLGLGVVADAGDRGGYPACARGGACGRLRVGTLARRDVRDGQLPADASGRGGVSRMGRGTGP